MTKTAEEKDHLGSGHLHEMVGEHSARCKREKHEDWQHGVTGCAVGPRDDPRHCDCKVRWVEVRT